MKRNYILVSCNPYTIVFLMLRNFISLTAVPPPLSILGTWCICITYMWLYVYNEVSEMKTLRICLDPACSFLLLVFSVICLFILNIASCCFILNTATVALNLKLKVVQHMFRLCANIEFSSHESPWDCEKCLLKVFVWSETIPLNAIYVSF